MSKKISRRTMIQLTGAGTLGFLASCAPKIVKETVVVEKEKIVEKPVEKVVEQTVVVEKKVVETQGRGKGRAGAHRSAQGRGRRA